MKKLFLEYIYLCMLLFGASCSNEDIVSVSDQSQKLEIMLDASSFRTLVSRAGNAAPNVELKNVIARTISASGSVLQDNISVTNLHWNGNNTYNGSMTVNDPSKVSKICFFANCFPPGTQPVVVAENIQTTFSPCTASGLTNGIPMWGVASWTKGTPLVAKLTRTVVATKFVLKVNNPTFQLKNIHLYNATDKVNLCSSSWAESAVQPELAGNKVTSGNAEEDFYFPEFEEMEDKSKRTCFILEATYNGATTFYRIDFYKNGDYFLPKRNSRYIFNILEVSQKGYDIKEEALRNSGANVQKKILIDIEDNSNEVATDGMYRFSFGAINTAVLDPKHFLITTFETDNEFPVTIEQIETGKNWLSNLKVEKKGTEVKRITGQNGEEKDLTVYKWEVYGDFSDCDQLKMESPVWGRRTHQVKLTCGRFQKKIGVMQSLMPLVFVNYKEYVKGENNEEIEVNTLKYYQMDLSKVKERYYRGLDLRPKPHKLRVWIEWNACSAGQNLPLIDLSLHIRVNKMKSDGESYTIKEDTKKVSVNRNNNGMVYFDIKMPDVESSEKWCKNQIELIASMGASVVDTKLYVEQRYIQEEDNK